MDQLGGLPLLEDLPELDGKRVLVRVDFNVPLHIGVRGNATVADDFRIAAALPTLRRLLDEGADVVAASHLGRPAGAPDPRWEMDPVRERLQALCPGVGLMENLRFDPGEKANDPAYVQRLIEGFDAYVDEAFGAAHRAHASIVGPPHFLPSAAGLRFAREVEVLGGILEHPARPFVAVVGGAKVADKLQVLKVLATKVDTLVVGGGMAYTFMAARGQHVGSSLLDETQVEACRELLDSGVRILLPTDTRALEPGGTFGPAHGGTRAAGKRQGDRGGPAGRLDRPGHRPGHGGGVRRGRRGRRHGALERAARGIRGQALRRRHPHRRGGRGAQPGLLGGRRRRQCQRALDELGVSDKIDFLSTGGGASLCFIEREGHLPGIDALRQAPNAPRG